MLGHQVYKGKEVRLEWADFSPRERALALGSAEQRKEKWDRRRVGVWFEWREDCVGIHRFASGHRSAGSRSSPRGRETSYFGDIGGLNAHDGWRGGAGKGRRLRIHARKLLADMVLSRGLMSAWCKTVGLRTSTFDVQGKCASAGARRAEHDR